MQQSINVLWRNWISNYNLMRRISLEYVSQTIPCRTPDVCTMQQDSSKDLEVVGSILHDVAGVELHLHLYNKNFDHIS